MTIKKITPYTGDVANPNGSQTQSEFTNNMFDQLSYEATFANEVNVTVEGINETSTEIDASVIEVRAGVDTVNNAAGVIDDAEQAAINANNAADTANQTINYFEATVSAQFAYKRIGNISAHVGSALPEADKLNSYQYPDDSGEWYGPVQDQSFPIVIPADPSSDEGWALVNALSAGSLSLYTYIVYKASGGNSAYENMIAEVPSSINAGDYCRCEGGTLFRKDSPGSFILASDIYVADFKSNNDDYIDDAIDSIKSYMVGRGLTGGEIVTPNGITRVSRGHDLSVTGAYIKSNGGRYVSRTIADSDGDYSSGYIIKIAPTAGQTISNGSGMERFTLDVNEAPCVGILWIGGYDTSEVSLCEVINGHKDYPCLIAEPDTNGTVIQSVKIDTSSFSKKSTLGTGYTVEIRKAQECHIVNTKIFGSPSNLPDKGSIPLLLEDVRGITIVGGGYANSESHCIDIYAKTRNTTHVTIIQPTFEGYKSKAIRTRAESGFFVSRLNVQNERLIQPLAGLLDGGSLTFSSIYSSNAEVELDSLSTNNCVFTYDESKVIDNGTYNTIIGTANSLNGNNYQVSSPMSVKVKSTPSFRLKVEGVTGDYQFRWSASSTADNGAGILTPNGSQPLRFMDDRLGFFGSSPIPKRPIPIGTDAEKLDSLILSLTQLGLLG